MKDFLSRLRDEYGPIESTHDFLASLRKQYDVSEDIAGEFDVAAGNDRGNLKYGNTFAADNRLASITEGTVFPLSDSGNIMENDDIAAVYQEKSDSQPAVNLANQLVASKQHKFTIGLFIEDKDDLEKYINKLEDFSLLDDFFEKNKKLEFDPDKKYKKHYKQTKEMFLKKVSRMHEKILKDGVDEDTTETVVDEICVCVSKFFIRKLLRLCCDVKSNKQNNTEVLKFFKDYEREINKYLKQIYFDKRQCSKVGAELSEDIMSKYEWPAGKNGNRIEAIVVYPYRISYKDCNYESQSRYVEGIAYTTDEKRGKEHD